MKRGVGRDKEKEKTYVNVEALAFFGSFAAGADFHTLNVLHQNDSGLHFACSALLVVSIVRQRVAAQHEVARLPIVAVERRLLL